MILLDTHVWVWWIHGVRLSDAQVANLNELADQGLGVSIISFWEVGKLVERGRLKLQRPLADWLENALSYPGVQLLDLTPPIVADSVELPGTFHQDPGDQMIVATARVSRLPLATADRKILGYGHVETLDFRA